MITQIGAWVLREACRQQHDWAATEPGLARLTVSVNLSPMQLAHADVARMIGDTLARTGADPERMIVELTESALVENTAANLDKLHAIKAVGVRLALDDFGTGFSSLGYLRQFPFDSSRLTAPSSVRSTPMKAPPPSPALLSEWARHSISRASPRASKPSARPTGSRRAGCDLAQGYLFAPPMPPRPVAPAAQERTRGRVRIGRP